jgi:hypothetical protein
MLQMHLFPIFSHPALEADPPARVHFQHAGVEARHWRQFAAFASLRM